MFNFKMIVPFIMGVVDGFHQPQDLTSGVTWDDDQDKNEAYDIGANYGQWLGSSPLSAGAKPAPAMRSRDIHGEDRRHTRTEWRNAVSQDDTQLGYWDWVDHMVEMENES